MPADVLERHRRALQRLRATTGRRGLRPRRDATTSTTATRPSSRTPPARDRPGPVLRRQDRARRPRHQGRAGHRRARAGAARRRVGDHGLYAAGNVSSAVMGQTYPGPGGTVGPALVFGDLAAEDLTRRDRGERRRRSTCRWPSARPGARTSSWSRATCCSTTWRSGPLARGDNLDPAALRYTYDGPSLRCCVLRRGGRTFHERTRRRWTFRLRHRPGAGRAPRPVDPCARAAAEVGTAMLTRRSPTSGTRAGLR